MPIEHATPVDLPATLSVERWSDPLIEEHGFAMDSFYVETFWLPTLGPTAMWLARRLAFVADNGGGVVPLVPLAREIGLGKEPRLGANDSLSKALTRLRTFGVVDLHRDVLRVRTHLAPLSAAQLKGLPPHLAAMLAAAVA